MAFAFSGQLWTSWRKLNFRSSGRKEVKLSSASCISGMARPFSWLIFKIFLAILTHSLFWINLTIIVSNCVREILLIFWLDQFGEFFRSLQYWMFSSRNTKYFFFFFKKNTQLSLMSLNKHFLLRVSPTSLPSLLPSLLSFSLSYLCCEWIFFPTNFFKTSYSLKNNYQALV